jgi:uncharacterized protein YcnI
MSTTGFTRAGARAGTAAGVVVLTGAALLLGSGIASAHVTARVIGEDAARGGYTKITFRVPNEEEDAGTVKLEIQLPTDTPLASVSTKPLPGWKATTTKAKLDKPVQVENTDVTEAVNTVTWTATPGVRINPGEFQEFEISGGPLPDTDQLMMPATQTYDNGDVVKWNEPMPASGEEPEHPAPMIAIGPAEEGGDHHGGAAASSGESHEVQAAAAQSTSDDTARWLGGAGLLVGVLGLGFGIGATMRARRATTSQADGSGSKS